MIILLNLVFISLLFIISKLAISRFLGIRASKILLGKVQSKGKFQYVISLEKRKLIKNIIVFLVIFIAMVINGYNYIISAIMGIGTIIIVYFAKLIKMNSTKKQVLCDLLNVSEYLSVQLSSQISLENSLRGLAELCENKEFAELLNDIYLEYQLSKFIILDSKKALINKFNYQEIRIFVSALNQQIQGTSALESFDNLITLLREKYIEFMEDTTKSKIAIMTAGVFIVVINIAAIGIYPVAVEAFYAMRLMLS